MKTQRTFIGQGKPVTKENSFFDMNYSGLHGKYLKNHIQSGFFQPNRFTFMS